MIRKHILWGKNRTVLEIVFIFVSISETDMIQTLCYYFVYFTNSWVAIWIASCLFFWEYINWFCSAIHSYSKAHSSTTLAVLNSRTSIFHLKCFPYRSRFKSKCSNWSSLCWFHSHFARQMGHLEIIKGKLRIKLIQSHILPIWKLMSCIMVYWAREAVVLLSLTIGAWSPQLTA